MTETRDSTFVTTLTADEMETILDALQKDCSVRANLLHDELAGLFELWFNERDGTGEYVNRT